MTSKLFIGVVTALVLVLTVLALGSVFFSAPQTDASVGYGGEYTARQMTSTMVGTTTLKSMAGTIGTIVVSSTSPVTTSGPVIVFYDTATTTVATTSLTAKMSFGARNATTPPAGDYTFDVAFGLGIFVWVDPSFNGSYTITYR